jgi:hypothetical protein
MLFLYLPVMLFEAFWELHTVPDVTTTERKTTDEV